MDRYTPALFEQISTQIGYRFENEKLLVRALTHASTLQHKGDYQRLEFLGDRVLGFIIAEHLFRDNPDHSEGQMSASHSSLVRSEACALAGDAIGLADLVILGSSERAKGMHLNRSMVGDVMEALIAAVYLDGGLDAARQFVMRTWSKLLALSAMVAKDAKTFLQEWALARALPIPVYRILSRAGPEHEPVFVVSVEVQGRTSAEGTARSKRAAEQDAADLFLKREGIRP